MFSGSFGTSRPPSTTPITYNESARMNFNYGWTWGMGNFMPATYLGPLNPEFSSVFLEPNDCAITKNCPLYPNANNFAVGGCSFLSEQVSPTQAPPQPTLYGGKSVDVPYQDPVMIRVFNFKRTDGKLSTPIMIQGRCEYLPTDFDSPCGAKYTDGPLKCDDTDLLNGLRSRSSNIPSFNSLIQYILDGAGDDADRNLGPAQPDYEIIDVPNGAVAIVLSTQFRESQDGVNDARPARFYVYLAKLDSDGNPSSTVLNPSNDYDEKPAEQPQTITTGDECNFKQDFMGYTIDEFDNKSWGEVVVNRDDNDVITASYSTKNQYGSPEIYTTEKGTIRIGPAI